ncbi:MAG: ISL3 family transposase [bacterium]|nr:ISL3 family transposase [bacterium]
MQLKTILNRVTNYKSFVVGKVKWAEDSEAPCLEVEMRPRANGHPICSGCGEKAPGYDQSRTPRRFEFVPMWMISVIFVYCMRRVNCPTCGVKVERVPWAEGKSPLTTEYKWFLARWARRMSWKEVSEAFRVSWDSVYMVVKQAVSWGLEHRDLEGIEAIGVDEVQWHKGHQYQTVVYQLDEGRKRLLWIGPDRRAKTLLRFFRFLGKERTTGLQFICSDMWRAYLKVIAKKAPQAVHVLDRFHIMQKMSKALDKVRAAEVKQLKADGYEPVLKGARWLLLKRPENQTERQATKLQEILQYNLKSIRSHLMKEDFQQFWEYTSPTWAGKFLDQWCTRAMRSKIDPMKKIAGMLRDKRELILNWFVAEGQLSSGIVEGFNNKLKLITRKSYGFRTQEAYETALYHTLGALPEPKSTHEFC